MPIGFIRRTFSFGLKIKEFTCNVAFGFTEEILFNVTCPANAFTMPDSAEVSNQILTTTKKFSYGVGSVLVGSQVKSKIVEVVAGATLNLIV